MWPGCQIGQQLPGGILFRGFLGRALRPSHKLGCTLPVLGIQPHLHGEGFIVLRPCFFYQHIRRLGHAQSLQSFLQRRLEIGERQSPAFPLHPLQLWGEDLAHHEFARRFQAAIQVDRRQNCLQCVHQQGRLAPATAFFLSPPQPQVMSQLQPLRHPDQVPFAHHVGPQFGEFAFAKMREALE